jgi:hypothetical protein
MAATQDIIGLLDSIIKRYSAGGEFGKGEEALLQREKTKAMASGQQRLVSAGLSGTTVGAGMGQRWEEEIGMPERLRLEDIRSQRLSEAVGAKAGYLEREQAREQQMQQTEMGALAQVHAAKYGGGGGGGQDLYSQRLFDEKPQPTATTAEPGGATQHIGQGGGIGEEPSTGERWYSVKWVYNENYPQGVPTATLGRPPGYPGAKPASWFEAQKMKVHVGGKAQELGTYAHTPTASPEFGSMAQTAQKWLTG